MTTAPVTDTVEHADVIKTLLSAALGPWDCFDYGQVPGTKDASGDQNPGIEPRQYVMLTVTRRSVYPARQIGAAGRSGWRVTIRSVGRIPDEVRWMQRFVTAALDEQRLTIDGHISTPLQLESGQDLRPDNGAYSALDAWTYAL